MPRTIALAFTAALLALGGCSSLSESQCLASDWETIGYRDGLGGTQSTALIRHTDACMKHGVVPDRDAYLAGWEDGVQQYCQPQNAFSVGEHGAGYANVCPPHLQQSFHAAYQDGRQLYLAQAEIDDLQRGIAQRKSRMRQVKSEMAAIASGMLDEESTTADRAGMLLSAKDLAQEQGRLDSEIAELEAEVAVKRDRLESLRHSLAFAD